MKTLEELRAAYPELVALAEAEVVAAERGRIRDIEDIAAAVGDAAMLREAKYGEKTCTAQELALAAMKAQAKVGAAFLENAAADHAASGAGDVSAAPNGGTDDDSEDVQVAGIVAAYKKTKGVENK